MIAVFVSSLLFVAELLTSPLARTQSWKIDQVLKKRIRIY